ncbi:MAG: hypothetical protein MJ149_03290 [Clostridia bacterium]|nr:hypothetical protein [Clostridia bacterium]
MTFVLIEKTKEEIDKEYEKYVFWSKRVKGSPKKVCPLAVKLQDGKVIDVWELDENTIVNLIETVVKEFNEGIKDTKKMNEVFKILGCWQGKHKIVSADMIESMYRLEGKYPKVVSLIKDFTTSIGFEQKQDAMKIAKYLNGMQGNKTKINHAHIVKILRNQENFAQNSQNKEASL